MKIRHQRARHVNTVALIMSVNLAQIWFKSGPKQMFFVHKNIVNTHTHTHIYMGSSSVLVLDRGNQRSKWKQLTAYPSQACCVPHTSYFKAQLKEKQLGPRLQVRVASNMSMWRALSVFRRDTKVLCNIQNRNLIISQKGFE